MRKRLAAAIIRAAKNAMGNSLPAAGATTGPSASAVPAAPQKTSQALPPPTQTSAAREENDDGSNHGETDPRMPPASTTLFPEPELKPVEQPEAQKAPEVPLLSSAPVPSTAQSVPITSPVQPATQTTAKDVISIKSLTKDERKVLLKSLKKLTAHKMPSTLENAVVKKALAQLRDIKPEKSKSKLLVRLAKGFRNIFLGRISSNSIVKAAHKLQKLVEKDRRTILWLDNKIALLENEKLGMKEGSKKQHKETEINEKRQKRMLKQDFLTKAHLS